MLLCASTAAFGAQPVPDDLRTGLIALQKNDLTLARQTLEHASTVTPENALVWAALAQAYLRSNQMDRARGAAERAAKLAPEDATIQHALALFWSEVGDAAQTITWATADLKHRNTAELHHLLAQAYQASNQPEKAIGEYHEAAERAPANETYAFDLGQMQLRRGDFAGALSTLGAARANFPKSAQIELAWGVAAYGQRRFQDAIDSFLRVIVIDPGVEQPYVFLAQVLDQAGDRMPRILAAFDAWRNAAPRNCLAWCLHAKALNAANGDPAQVEAELRRSIELNGAYWQSHFELGQLLAREKKWPQASAELARSIELNPQNAGAHFQLARVYERMGMKEQALAERAAHERMTAAETGSPLDAAAGAKGISLP